MIKECIAKFIPDSIFLKYVFKKKMGYDLNLKNPKTYNEKLQWMKLYDRNPLYTKLVDKYEVKEYVSNVIGDEYIIPTLGVWNSFDEIDFDSLPNQFVIKCTHDSGGLYICKDKSNLDKQSVEKVINNSLKNDYYMAGREWPYKNVKRRIIAEEYMEDSVTKELRDYKFFVFNGIVKAMFIATERQVVGEDVKFDFFDENFNHLPIKQGHQNAKIPPEKPLCFDKMKELAAMLGKDFKQVRVDFYEVDGRIYFGELTFFHHCGWTPFEPKEWDYKFGEWIEL